MIFEKLDQHAIPGFGMDEGNAPAMRPVSWTGINEAHPGGGKLIERGLEIRHAKRHVMHAFAALLHKSRDCPLGIGGLNEFQVARAKAIRNDADALLGNLEPLAARETKRRVPLLSRAEVGDDDAEMVEFVRPGIEMCCHGLPLTAPNVLSRWLPA
jgi:hypothetical protein